ncbi:OstA family protein [Aureimonas fodinaquatilis]|uniref:OstA family protein n=1 Tax=Aureimonas fodinaquatilis TaxID=2565783 RepID=A0A5B0DP57_9HYPH|nr:LptA/OstA family protein [Aureimonas fodinaquatilis]KAA0968544.1 OstA family protein [Aureimonas fodinaquatilis]
MNRFVKLMVALAVMALPSAVYAQQGGFGENFGGLQVQGDQPITIESNQLDVDDANSIATFSGDVEVVQGETMMRAAKLIVHYVRKAQDGAQAVATSNMPGNSSDIDRLEAEGDVYVKSTDQVATANRADFDMKTQIVVMSGDVVLTQGPNVATGCRLTIHMETSVAQLQSRDCGGAAAPAGGRVRMLLSPNSQPNG